MSDVMSRSGNWYPLVITSDLKISQEDKSPNKLWLFFTLMCLVLILGGEGSAF